tara:strand:+ start:285 stop:461 length:177 start_codon:yes stop_codon:yes gene_type:complete
MEQTTLSAVMENATNLGASVILNEYLKEIAQAEPTEKSRLLEQIATLMLTGYPVTYEA